jgi:hypothetical protein
VLEDLAGRTDEELLGLRITALARLVLLLYKHIRDGDILERLPSWSNAFIEAYQSSGYDALVRVLMDIIEVVEVDTLDHLEWVDEEVNAPEGKVIMTLAEKLRQEGEQRGLEKGLEQGREQGQRDLLLKQLQLRFGELNAESTLRVQEASVFELEAMVERVLTAQTLEEVLSKES